MFSDLDKQQIKNPFQQTSLTLSAVIALRPEGLQDLFVVRIARFLQSVLIFGFLGEHLLALHLRLDLNGDIRDDELHDSR